MVKHKREIPMIVDNCPAHPAVNNFCNLTLKFLPPNTTSLLQPIDQGITKNFKAYYRKTLLTSALAKCELDIASKINVLDAIF